MRWTTPWGIVGALGDIRLETGVVLTNARIAYATFGKPNANRRHPDSVLVRIGSSQVRDVR